MLDKEIEELLKQLDKEFNLKGGQYLTTEQYITVVKALAEKEKEKDTYTKVLENIEKIDKRQLEEEIAQAKIIDSFDVIQYTEYTADLRHYFNTGEEL